MVLRVSSASMMLFKALPSLAAVISPGPFSTAGLLPLLMCVLGTLILVGLLTRVSALISIVMMTVIYVAFHAPLSISPADNGGVPAILSASIFLHLMVSGPGRWSLDVMRGRRAASSQE